MHSHRRWYLAVAAAVAVLAAAIALALAVNGDDSDPASVATGTSTSTTTTTATSTSLSAGGDSGTPSPSTTVLPATPRTTRPTAPATTIPGRRCSHPAPGSDFDGFGAAEIVIENSEGSHRSCVLTADTPSQQQRGLMAQDDLDGYDGMIFRFPASEERSFWMRNTSIPLSIAFFDGAGAFVSATDMDPCRDSPDCPNYRSRGAAKFALEVIRGQLPSVGATPGSRLIS